MKQFILFVLCVLTAVSLSAQNKLPFYDRGYAGNVELGCLVKSYPYASLSTTHGYSFGKGWFLGLGGAFESGLYVRYFDNPGAEEFPYEGDMMVKLFLDVRKTFLMKSMGIFVDFKMGGPCNLAEKINNKYEWGTFLRPAVGVVFSRRFAFSAGLDWSRLNYYEGKNSGCMPYWPKEITLPFISFAYQF